MRILLLNTSFTPQVRSASRLYHDLGAYLVRCGHHVTVITEMPWRRLGIPADDTIPEREEIDGMQVVRVSAYRFGERSMLGRGINLALIPFKFYQAAQSLGPHDVVLIYSPPLSLGITGWMLHKLQGTPFILNVQDIYPQTVIDLGYMKNSGLARLFEILERFVYRRAARLVMHSQGNVNYLLKHKKADPSKTLCLPNWIDTAIIEAVPRSNRFRCQHQLGDAFIVCYAGTMGYAQDLTPLIDAATILKNERDILVLLVGEGVLRSEFEARARGLDNVKFLPLQPGMAYRDLLSDIDVGFVSLTDKLSTPVVPAKLLDFMAAGRPVIASTGPASDTGAIVSAANCGRVCSPRDPGEIAAAIRSLRANPAQARSFGQNGRSYAETHFSLHTCAEAYLELFQQVCGATETSVAFSSVALPMSSDTSPTY